MRIRMIGVSTSNADTPHGTIPHSDKNPIRIPSRLPLAPLGLHRKRARAFVRLSEDYLNALEASEETDVHIRERKDGPRRVGVAVASLHGVGAYAADAHALFCEGTLGVAPRDHALRWWYAWAIERREGERRQAAERRRRNERGGAERTDRF